jgi:hypothetical protein
MSVKGIIFNKQTPQSGVATSADSTSGMILGGVAVSGTLALNTKYKLRSVRDAIALGITEDYDKANAVLVYYHISEFYRRTRKKPGTVLYIMIVAQTVTLPQMIDDTGAVYAKKLLTDAKSEIKQLGFGFNPTETTATGGNFLFTAIGADNDTAVFKLTIGSTVLILGSYKKVSGDSTVALVATAVRAAINLLTPVHGFVAAGTAANVLLTAPKGYGDLLSTGTPLSVTIVGTIAATVTQFTGGAGYAPTVTNNMAADSFTAIANAQLLYDWAFNAGMPCQMIIEGKKFTGTAATAQDLHNLPSGADAPNTSLVVGQDWDWADTLPLYYCHAAVGTKLGDVAMRNVNENTGWVEVGDLTSVAEESWINAGFSSHAKIDTLKEDWDILDGLGYIFPITYPNLDGIYWNNDWTCAKLARDGNGNLILSQMIDGVKYLFESRIYLGRTIDKAIRQVYAALIKDVKSPQAVDPATGKLPTGVITYFKKKGENAIDDSMTNQISGRKVFIDPDSDLLNAPQQLLTSIEVVPYGNVDSIKVNIGITNRIQ